MTFRTRRTVLLVTAPIILFVVIGGLLGQTISRSETYRHLRVFEDVISLVLANYVEQVEPSKVMTGAMRGLADGLDADSAYLPADQVRLIERGDKPPAAEVGLILTRQYYLRIVAARDGTPARRAGLLPGDYVRAIDGKPTREMSAFEGMHLLGGAPGSKVSLMIIRGNAAEPHVIELVREAPPAADVSGRIAAPGIGYLRIAAFGPRAVDAIKSQVTGLSRAGATRLLVDVRSTAAGQLADGLTAARPFVGSGTLGIRETKGAVRKPVVADDGDGSITLPVVLLVNAGTSGPAELFAAALAGNRRAEMIGERTLGRAGEQTVAKLPDGSGLWLTTAWYLTPGGVVIHEKGLTPDVQVAEPDVEFGATPPSSDPILEKGLERLKNRQ
jgi:carboxyl-terminal processing protease